MPIPDRAYTEKLFHSCRILFGSHADVGWDFLFYLQMSGLKSAFREKALLTHPDRAFLRGESSAGPETFIAAREAYEQLTDFIRLRHTIRPWKNKVPPRSARKQNGRRRRRAARTSGGYYYQGTLPGRKLLLGEYLFYAGYISWETLIKSVVWQRSQRPRLGEMAISRGWLQARQVRDAALMKKLGIPIGEELVRRRLLTRNQVKTLVLKQRLMQKALGEYFVQRGILSRERLATLALHCFRHNIPFREPRAEAGA